MNYQSYLPGSYHSIMDPIGRVASLSQIINKKFVTKLLSYLPPIDQSDCMETNCKILSKVMRGK